MSAYHELATYIADVDNIQKAISLLDWDEQVMMPAGGAADRGAVMGTLQVMLHQRMVSDELARLLDAATVEDLDPWDKRNVDLIRQKYQTAKAVPDRLVRALAEAGSAAFEKWGNAKPKSDWKAVQEPLRILLDLPREYASICGAVLQCDPYDALMGQSSEGNNRALVDPLFDRLKQDLPPLIRQITQAQASWPTPTIAISDSARQPLIDALADKMGIDRNRARIDTALHPFSSGSRNDRRFTVSRHEGGMDMIGSFMHEAGHALFTQRTPRAYAEQFVGKDRDLVVHESQSLFAEKQIRLHDGFLHYLHGLIVNSDPTFQNSVADIRHYYHRVQPSLIRIDADEATYPLHVILRYEIEKDLFSGAISVNDIPELWNAKIKEYLGIDVPDHARGCMQDVHWFSPYGFGYFPTYTQGALYAAQFKNAMLRDIPDFDDRVARGDLKAIMQWLTDKVHSWGSYYAAPELMKAATGEVPDARYFIDHLKQRYLGE